MVKIGAQCKRSRLQMRLGDKTELLWKPFLKKKMMPLFLADEDECDLAGFAQSLVDMFESSFCFLNC